MMTHIEMAKLSSSLQIELQILGLQLDCASGFLEIRQWFHWMKLDSLRESFC
jgi:hypothetical protein